MTEMRILDVREDMEVVACSCGVLFAYLSRRESDVVCPHCGFTEAIAGLRARYVPLTEAQLDAIAATVLPTWRSRGSA